MVLIIQPFGRWATYSARRASAPFEAPLKPGDCLPLVAQHLVPEKGAGKKTTGKKGEKLSTLYLKRAREKRQQAKKVGKKSIDYCFIGIGIRSASGGGGEGGVECAQRTAELAPCCLGIHRVRKIKNETKPLY